MLNLNRHGGAAGAGVLSRSLKAGAGADSSALGAWNDQVADEIKEALQQRIYGRVPQVPPLRVVSRRLLQTTLGRIAIAERWCVEFSDEAGPVRFDLLSILPVASPPKATLLAQVFRRPPSPLARMESVLARSDGRLQSTFRDALLQMVLGRHIHAPPFEQIIQAGFGIVLFCPGDVVPDNRRDAPLMLTRLSPATQARERAGALAGWAGLASAVRRLFMEDSRFASQQIVAWGHSRHGKAALLAAAFDDGFAGVIAHQSGRFGASLTQSASGETPAQIARAYPHWFCARFHDETLRARSHGFDQHHLLALIAPRPILLGNARRDFWADPKGAFDAAQAASPAFALHGEQGVAQVAEAPGSWKGGIGYFTREGGHGLNAADWNHFLGFMAAKFGAATQRADSRKVADRGLAPRRDEA